MLKYFKEISQIKYLIFYYQRLKWRIPVLLGLSAVVAVLDGLGLALFIPLFQVAESGDTASADLGKLDFVIDFFNYIGMSISIGNILLFMIIMFAFKGWWLLSVSIFRHRYA
ncbi:hypothetical protein [Geofilum rubicundum]|uniref:Phospholipid-lipopolysaccharide ABC transporter n=1 Tax=Geofilum rubicundum JCM 15548 TaxID=1236989 RepID=A0A0E9LTP6_9BACT|nr:hypothetical protein [Geofilum rubicundum]GAO28501.1 phospholipid-lipopolysaccharide ABC transporter [Geofilum rubicundum JCM 15548]